jgi:hypothetical protein
LGPATTEPVPTIIVVVVLVEKAPTIIKWLLLLGGVIQRSRSIISGAVHRVACDQRAQHHEGDQCAGHNSSFQGFEC